MVGAVAMALAGPGFTLRWTHSVERVDWVEEWRVDGPTLRLDRVRIKGSGAGMEPGEGATLREGWWVWAPGTTVRDLRLAASGATGAGWRLCDGAACREIGATAGQALVVRPCDP